MYAIHMYALTISEVPDEMYKVFYYILSVLILTLIIEMT